MASIANLAVSLTAKTGEFTSGFAKAARTMTSFSAIAGAVSSGIKHHVVGAMAGAFGIGAVEEFIRHSMEGIDATARLSDSIGISTEQLIGFQYAAKMADIDQESLTKALQKGVRVLGSGDEITKFADKIRAMPNASQRAAAAVKVFGRDGAALLPLLLQGSKGMNAMKKEAEMLGLSFSRTDAAQVEMAEDSLKRLGTVGAGIGNQLAIAFAPAIQFVGTELCIALNDAKAAFYILGGAVDSVINGSIKRFSALGYAVGTFLEKISQTGSIAYNQGEKMRMFYGAEINGSNEFAKQAERNYKSAGKAADAANMLRASSVEDSMTKAKEMAKEAAKLNAGPDGIGSATAEKKHATEFKQISLQRFSVFGSADIMKQDMKQVRAAGVEQRLDKLIAAVTSKANPNRDPFAFGSVVR